VPPLAPNAKGGQKTTSFDRFKRSYANLYSIHFFCQKYQKGLQTTYVANNNKWRALESMKNGRENDINIIGPPYPASSSAFHPLLLVISSHSPLPRFISSLSSLHYFPLSVPPYPLLLIPGSCYIIP
jgi:hypothetical protein